ncbi:MFS transporter [Herbaspirillum sp. RV1423]|uniref:MFS transporter n=1 Tax=Herbaspirillum sp. RV1423 TaxID=1443993 RepID=UPI0004B67A10|nr:MFS transporter [Herbaspirillum sp. RV1423]
MAYANAASAGTLDAGAEIGKRVIGKLHRKIVWYCFFLFMINYLDRVNVGFAALTMNADLGLSAKVYGLGAGIFFLGYIAFEIPSNMILHKVGPRIWIARILVTWGIVGCAMAAIQGAWSFYALRFLLGLAEAGFAPGVLLYMTYWFPKKERGKAVAGFMLATVLSSVVGAPLSGYLLSSTHGWFGLSGWQWMFILEGLPAIVMGIVTFFYLVDRPEQGKWLDNDERRWLTATLAAEQEKNAPHAQHEFKVIFRDKRMWVLTLVYMFNAVAIYGVVLWLPQIVKSLGGLNNFQTGIVSAIPFLCAAVGLVLVARSSDRTGERKMHTACAGLCGGVFLAASALVPSPLAGLILICIAAMGLWATLGVFWTLPTQFLTGAAAAGGIAMINGFAQIGGFVGPYLVGWIRETTQSFSIALLVLAVSPMIGFVLCASLKIRNDRAAD